MTHNQKLNNTTAVRIPKSLNKRLRICAVNNDTTSSAIATEAIEKELEKREHNKKDIK